MNTIKMALNAHYRYKFEAFINKALKLSILRNIQREYINQYTFINSKFLGTGNKTLKLFSK